MVKDFKGPRAIHVYVTIEADPKRGIDEPYTGRVGTCNKPDEVKALIAADVATMRQTFGGLIEPGRTKGRTYRAFRAEWTELKI